MFKNDWENPHVTQKNRCAMHFPAGAYENVAQALACDRNASRYVQSLNGVWRFCLCESPEDFQAGCIGENFDDTG